VRSRAGAAILATRLLPSILVLLVVLGVRVAAAQPPPPGPQQPAPARDEEPYHLTADRLEGSVGAGENVYTAIRPTVVHGTTTVTGDSALIYKNRELVLFRGNVRIVDGRTHMWGREASYDRKTRLATLRGNVRIEEGTAKITGNEARFYRTENRSVITGNPRLEDSTRTVTADRIEYDRSNDIVTALGKVDAIDRAESTRVRAGRVRYDRRADYAWATEDPVLVREERKGQHTTVRGDTLEFDNSKRRAYAIGNVRVEREKLRATGTRAEFDRAEDRAILVGKPRAWDDQGVAYGDTIEIGFDDNQLRTLRIHPNAVVEFTAKADSGRGERNIATGDTITVHFEKEEAREALMVGHAESRYWPSSADSAQGGRNVSNGDSIRVFFEKGEPERAIVRGGGKGTYFLSAEGDTVKDHERELVRYEGNEIQYEIKKGTVDIVGNSDVVYRDVHLTADRVTFDSNTDHMRAEGSPVLTDAGNRMTGASMTYDLNTRQGTVFEGRTAYDRGFLFGERVRRVSDTELDVAHGTYSTCDLTEPHYHFESSKMKVMLHDKVIARPVVFYIKKVPVLALPFYVFPIQTGRHSGFQLPQVEFGSSTGGGKFVRNVGYYWAIDDFMDATGWFDYYQQESWLLHGLYRYNRRYEYQGQISASYQNQFTTGANRWDLFGRHFQTLGRNFTLTGQANLTNSSEYRRDQNLGQNVFLRVQRNLDSNLSLQKGWSGGSLSFGLLQREDLDASPGALKTEQQLPSLTLRLNQRPIGRSPRGQEPARWPAFTSTVYTTGFSALYQRREYASIAHAESTVVLDSLGTPVDTTIASVTVDSLDARGAARYDFALTDVRSLGFIKVSPSVFLNAVYYSRDQAGQLNQVGAVWGAGLSMNTAVTGTFHTSIGPLRAIRHVITPLVSASYQPPRTSLLYQGSDGFYRPRFDGVSGISLAAAEVRRLNFSLRQDVHAKWGDPIHPKVINNLIQLQSDISYNGLAKRSGAKPLSDLSTTLNLKPIDRSDFAFRFVHNPYDARLLFFSASTGIALQGQSPTGEDYSIADQEPGTFAVRERSPLTPVGMSPAGLPWSVFASISYDGSRARDGKGGYTDWHSEARLNGGTAVNFTKNWRLEYNWQFDPRAGIMVSQFFTVKRDLHCWEMQFTRSLSGDVGDEYYFKINVKNLPEVYFEQGSRGLRGFGALQNIY
jgi:lipopolysaccharide assembly outer membrane protein LptD (OstA)